MDNSDQDPDDHESDDCRPHRDEEQEEAVESIATEPGHHGERCEHDKADLAVPIVRQQTGADVEKPDKLRDSDLHSLKIERQFSQILDMEMSRNGLYRGQRERQNC